MYTVMRLGHYTLNVHQYQQGKGFVLLYILVQIENVFFCRALYKFCVYKQQENVCFTVHIVQMICTNNREKTCFTIVVKILYINSYKRICLTILYCTLVQILCTSNCKMSCCYELNKFSVQTTRKELFYSTVHTFGTNKRKTFFLGT